MSRIVVSTWTRHQFNHQVGRNTKRRLAAVDSAVREVARTIETSRLDSIGVIRGIMVAPEYFFANEYAGMEYKKGIISPRSINNDERKKIVSELRILSSRYPRILIMPGTIAWKKPIDMQKCKQRLNYYTQRKANKPALQGQELNQAIRYEFEISMLDGTIVNKSTRNQYNIANNCPMPTAALTDTDLENFRTKDPNYWEYLKNYVEAANSLDSVLTVAKQRVDFFEQRGIIPTHMMQNTAYAFLNGKVVFKYAKQTNFKEEIGDDCTGFVPGAKSGVQTIEGIRFGFEVCLDHNMGMLARQLRKDRQIDVQVVMSAFVHYAPGSSVVRNGGYFIHASTNPSESGVWRMNNHQSTLAKSLGRNNVDSSELSHWEMDTDIDDAWDIRDLFGG